MMYYAQCSKKEPECKHSDSTIVPNFFPSEKLLILKAFEANRYGKTNPDPACIFKNILSYNCDIFW